MEIFEKLATYIEELEEKKFKLYLGIFLASIVVISGGIVFRYYRQVHYLQEEIDDINDLRKQALRILDKAQEVQLQRKEVDTMLEKDKDFKIGGYLTTLLTDLNLTQKVTIETTAQFDRDEDYRESVLNAKFAGINMKELTKLLNEIEQNPRIYTKELEITKSKTVEAIDGRIVIATLQKKFTE